MQITNSGYKEMISLILQIHQWVRLVISIIYLSVVAFFSLLPPNDLPKIPLFEGVDKIIHALMYIGLTWLLCWLFSVDENQIRYYLAAFFSVCWGVILEICQLTMDIGRSFEFSDIIGNSIGTLFGVFIYMGMKKMNNRLAFKKMIKY